MSAIRRAVRKGWAVVEVRHKNYDRDQNRKDHGNLNKWAKNTFEPGSWLSSLYNEKSRFVLKNEADAVLFRMRWL